MLIIQYIHYNWVSEYLDMKILSWIMNVCGLWIGIDSFCAMTQKYAISAMTIKFGHSFCAMSFFLWKVWKFYLRNESLPLSPINILFAQCKFFLRNETFDSNILYSFCVMIKNASIRKSNSPVLPKTRFQMLFPHLLAILAYNKNIFFLLLTKFILRNVPKSDKILIIQWYAKKRNV